jgi:uncharacterized membrane protein
VSFPIRRAKDRRHVKATPTNNSPCFLTRTNLELPAMLQHNNYSALSRQSPLTQLVNQMLSAIKENIMTFLYTVLISRSIDASTRARDPNKDFIFIFPPQWVTEEKN